MKRSLMAPLWLAIVALATTPVTATGESPGTDSVSGSAKQCVELIVIPPDVSECARELQLTVDVESGSAGENPAGSVTWSQLGLTPGGSPSLTAEATCLSVSGDVAIIGVTGTLVNPALEFGTPIAGLIRVVDGGGPNSAADRFQFAFQTGTPGGPPLPGPSSCSTFPGTFPTDSAAFPAFVNEVGDVVVTDTQPFPTTKDECKHGGWRDFPDITNQGECVSFVATGGQKPPVR
jgi:hypothetical protein